MANYDLRQPLDFKFGQLSGGVTALDTTLNSSAFASLPSDLSSTKYQPITLADDTNALYETVWITAHSAASTAVTVVRGREGTSARSWSAATPWRGAVTARDLAPIYTRAGLPSDAPLGMRAVLSDELAAVEKVTNGWVNSGGVMLSADAGKVHQQVYNPPAGVVLSMRAASFNATTDSNGDVSVNYTRPFPTATLCCLVVNASYITPGAFHVGYSTAVGFSAKKYTAVGAQEPAGIGASGHYIAIGY